jgi:hypothetical protein
MNDLEKFQGPADEYRQKTVSDLCEVLGIDNIDVTNYRLDEAIVLITALKQVTNKYESRK